MNILILGRGRTAGHTEIRLRTTSRHDRGALHEIRAQADSDVACPFVLTELECADSAPVAALDLARETVIELIVALVAPPAETRTISNFSADDFEIAHEPAMDRLVFTDLEEDSQVYVPDAPETRNALAEALRIAVSFFDRDQAIASADRAPAAGGQQETGARA